MGTVLVMFSGGTLGGEETLWVETGILPDPDNRPYMDFEGERYVLINPGNAVFFGQVA